MPKDVVNITAHTFRPYGRVIEYPKKEAKGMVRNLWRIVHTDAGSNGGWRVAYLVLRDKSIGRLECHPNTDETFEPVNGKALLFVSRTKDLQNIVCFKLDKPIVLFKGIWHGLISITPESEIKITEGARVRCQYWPFGFRVQSFHDLCERRES